ncbi:MAG: sensor histidine kinase N-terminal domain-containing protein [Thermomonas sp.]|uniref:ATP-binding protein n=1 Tax=Thermomonas sp. TaxID=1971895 RepID=UPI001D591C84|nr:ATP-binding protein [Thermomonas sp.]MBZ0088630.1 sensor histidine kinase N-terminal domain-containing protein [Thermomonas sp.]MCO5056032.1 ATP-binding protein [Thermomonas sp.]
MKTFSVRRRLLVMLLGSLALVWIVMLGFGYQKAHEEIHELSDARLQQAARTLLVLDLKRLTRLAQADENRTEDDPNNVPDEQEAPPLAFQAWGSDGRLLLDSVNAPDAPYTTTEGYATRRIDGKDWRSYSVQDHKHDYRVTVLEPLSIRDHPARELAGRMGQVLLIALPLLALLVWISIHQGFAPLARMSTAIAARDAGNLEPLQLERVPQEAAALVRALNALLARLARSLDQERAFTADAAHELRTPLAAIKVQAEVALAAQDETTRRQAIGQVIAGVDRATHLAQQLLLLARLEHTALPVRQSVDLGQLAASAIARRADEALAKGIECELVAGSDCILPGDPDMLTILIDNLLDNAIKYGGQGGHVAIRVLREGGALHLVVEDDGDGVANTALDRLRDRFFRVEGQPSPGSGLGLSIVEKIARAHDGCVELGSGMAGRGLGVRVRFGG